MEKFLDFWSHHNATIIESLVGLILISTIYLVYRTFFGAKEAEGDGAGINTAHIEKTLQKILDQQGSAKPAASSGEAGDVPAEIMLELQDLKLALEEKEKQIVVLNEKAVQANKAATAPGAGPSQEAIAAAANAAAGLAEKERADYEAKIKELEGRLAEYEIISEDIADLSFFKEENARLTKEIEDLRGGGAAPAAAAPAAAPAAPAAAAATPPPAAAAAPVVEAAAPAADAGPAVSAEAANAIDDSLMAEFAAAVEGQKSATQEAAPKSEDNKLLEEFENFNKKS